MTKIEGTFTVFDASGDEYTMSVGTATLDGSEVPMVVFTVTDSLDSVMSEFFVMGDDVPAAQAVMAEVLRHST